MTATNMCSNFDGKCSRPPLYGQAERKKDQKGIPVFGPKIVKRGLWSVTKVNFHPYIYIGGIFLSHTASFSTWEFLTWS